jgi:Leucine-rich repeat (LRR) protein
VHSDQNLKSLNFQGNQVTDFQAVKQKETIVRIFLYKICTIAFQIPDKEHLQVSMVDSLAVAITHTINKLLEVSPGFGFTKTSMMNLHNHYNITTKFESKRRK